jgi:alpha-mannosidase
MKRLSYLLTVALLPSLTFAQPLALRENYNIDRDKVLYVIGYAHLDTEWNWDYPTVIDDYIKKTMVDNFALFEKYPDYVFNFTGSRRYNMMKEYYPDLYKKVKDYIRQGRWYIAGSSVDEAEVNISSSESLLRQVLYGNLFFKREFKQQSADYMLPDCFGFVATCPSVWAHAGLLGFSTQKLTWGSANGIPFNVGLWEGPDGKDLVAALNATSYNGDIVPRLDRDRAWTARMDGDVKKYGLSFDYRYYGTGDQGGAPRQRDVQHAVESLKHGDSSNFKVILTSSDQLFKDLTPALRAKLPSYSGDLLLVEHSAGSLTSQAFMKRANRKNELLAKSAEQLSSVALWLGEASYPTEKLNRSWDLVLGSQFHDILSGTATPKSYEYAWNDEFIAMNGFSEAVKHSVSAIARHLNTQTQGRSIVVYNPVAIDREDVVTAELSYAKKPEHVQVLDKDGNTVPSQIIANKGNAITLLFLAKLPSAGLAVFDVRESGIGQGDIRETSEKPGVSTLITKDNTLENEFFKVSINVNGDIASIYDKLAQREVLSQPASLQFQKEDPTDWPAWNMYWKDRRNPPIDAMNKNVTIKVVEQGPVRVAIEVTKKGQNSSLTQHISLAAGEPGKRIEVRNSIDWQSTGVSLKAAFPTTVQNEQATYGLNTAAIQRSTNNEVKFEVPARQWFDLTDRSNSYGVSILEDGKYGSDKPDNSTVRLTLMFTPEAHQYIYQNSQDWGIHHFTYAIYPHAADWVHALSPWQGSFVNSPLVAFETTKHDGPLGKTFSLVSLNSNNVDIMAFKKAEESDYCIVRFNELYGKDAPAIAARFPGKIVDAYEVNGQEQKIGEASFADGSLHFDMTRFAIRSFAIKLGKPAPSVALPEQKEVELPYNEDVISSDDHRTDGNMADSLTLPAELIPAEIVSEDIRFKMASTADGASNAVTAKGQTIELPAGNYKEVYLLAAATHDTTAEVSIGKQKIRLGVQAWTGYIGQHYGRKLTGHDNKVTDITPAFVKGDDIAWFASHCHSPKGNEAYQYSYLYKYAISIPKGAKSITLPKNAAIKIFAMTVANDGTEDATPLQPLYENFKNDATIQLRKNE